MAIEALAPGLPTSRLLQFSLLLLLLDVGPSLAAEMAPPPIGRHAAYVCTGNFGSQREYTVRSINGDIVRIDGSSGGKQGYTLKPFWLGGTRLYQERGFNGRVTQITVGLEDFAGLRTLTPGTNLEGSIAEQSSDGQSTRWNVAIGVRSGHAIDNDILGHVDVAVIQEVWIGESVTIKAVTNLAPSRSIVVSWRHEMSDGRYDDCKLAALDEP